MLGNSRMHGWSDSFIEYPVDCFEGIEPADDCDNQLRADQTPSSKVKIKN